MDFIVTISGDAEGPFNIYYDSVSSGTLVDSNVSKASLSAGYSVTISGTPTSIIVVNTDSDCQNSQTYYLPTPTPTPTIAPTFTPTPTPTLLNCGLWGGSVAFTGATPTPTPTATATPTPAGPPSTPTPTPTGTVLKMTAEVILNNRSPLNIFEVSNGTVGGSINSINVVTPLYPAYGTNDYYIPTGPPTTVVYRVRKTSPLSTADYAGSVFIQVDGVIMNSYSFNAGDIIDYYFNVSITTLQSVSIQIVEG